MTDHEHEFAEVVAHSTEPGATPAKWAACRSCGVEDPDNPKLEPEGENA